ncbi:Peptide transporter family 1 [Orchesella cincta]|uniref:Peptide transporter family 1 n=1 Tax=Orchesella cincta TaxID=48709 RepID=A0A1D2NL45_ORCCI|nr:Peptide transporter family 1 [Orchesella cincta]
MELTYPKSVILICINEFFERFTFYGIRTTLPLFLKNGLGYDEDNATVIFHLFFMLSYFTPLIGATVADCFIGNYRTILWFTVIYVFGSGLLALSAISALPLPYITFAIIGLVLISLGSGGIKPCITTFGGDQFKVPIQLAQQITFFAIFNWIIAAANLSATFVAPILRSQQCFGQDTCFSLLFLVALAFLIMSVVFLVAGKRLYAMKEPDGNILARVAKCILTGVAHKIKESKTESKQQIDVPSETRSHWLDSSVDKHGSALVEEIKVVFGLLPLYVPLCFFWALYDQQSSRWTFQASRMKRELWGVSFEPEQFQVTNRLLILALIPLFQRVIYPMLGKCGLLKKQLSRIFWGGIFAALAFLMSGFLEIQLKDSTAENSNVHIIWQLPQLVAMVIAEIMFQISGMEFSYSAAPDSMKSLMQAVWLLTSAFGNLIVALVAKFKFFEEQEYEFFLFSGLMVINMLLFAVLCWRYHRRIKRTSSFKKDSLSSTVTVTEDSRRNPSRA